MKTYGHKFEFCAVCNKETVHFLLADKSWVFVCRHEYLRLLRLQEERDLRVVEISIAA